MVRNPTVPGVLAVVVSTLLTAACDVDWSESDRCSGGVGPGVLEQHGLVMTGIATDVALVGPGFLVVDAGGGQERYTRLGQLTIDDAGRLVTLDGLPVKGFDGDGAAGLPGPITIPQASPSFPTGRVYLVGNLSSDAPVQAFSAWDPVATSAFDTTVSVWDTLGLGHLVRVFLTNEGRGAWAWHAMDDGSGLEGGTTGSLTVVAEGRLAFDGQGRLQAQAQEPSRFHPRGASAPQPLLFDFGDDLVTYGTGLRGMTQFAAVSSMTWIAGDGRGVGQAASIWIDPGGGVEVEFTNHTGVQVARLALATFEHPEALVAEGRHLLRSAPRCTGEVRYHVPYDGEAAYVVAGALEALP